MNKFQIFVAVCAVGFIIFGIQRGEIEIIFKKAARICMECIGLG